MKLLNIILLIIIHTSLFGNPLIDEVLDSYFHKRQTVSIEPLVGGYEAKSYLLQDAGRKYVLRVFNPNQPAAMTVREIAAMQAFAKIGVSPAIYFVTSNGQAILMDYIEGSTSTIAEAKRAENRLALAQTLRRIHATEPLLVPSEKAFFKRSEDFHLQICKRSAHHFDADQAMAFIEEKEKELPNTQKANLHGDLNPHNIFFTQEGVKLIDWTYTRWDDPFYDVSYYALLHAYTEEEERHLLELYLEHLPDQAEIARYALTKKLNLANLYLNIYSYVLEQLEEDPTQEVDFSARPQTWNYYVEQFGAKGTLFSLQFFCDWARSALNESN